MTALTSADSLARLFDAEPLPLPILHRPCSWHTPKMELLRLNRTYPGQVSHTICESCRLEMERAS